MASATSSRIRPAAVAGMFYARDRQELARTLDAMLASAADRAPARAVPKAIIAPHAGYIYSGPIAASVYALLKPARGRITRVVLLGPTHRVAVRGLALPESDAFATPLGTVEIDREAAAAIRALPQVVLNSAAHTWEHSLEVHVPFLQSVLDEFRLVPLAVGYAEPEQVAEVLDALWGGPETLIVISSDLSHYLSHSEAQALDRRTAEAILDLRTDITHEQACGATPVTGLNLAAQRRRLKPELVDLRNSGDTAGDKNRVVGYGAFAFFEEPFHAH
ncbi:MAG: AmmeMemoRadiSam system protein B [Betaproteobacteria bacterium RIFCSPLOWO2_12_FULL_62_13]|nr:MAG: AmmeMemoRadiSam system protein B [Betaproteobacteria bacterium RIFCSPLOWO2_12_FULL_62_13]